MAKKTAATEKTRYQQWIDAGMPYYEGLSMFNEVRGYDPLKRLLARNDQSLYNRQKLKMMLLKHFHIDPLRTPHKRTETVITGGLTKKKGEGLKDVIVGERTVVVVPIEETSGQRSAVSGQEEPDTPTDWEPEALSERKVVAIPFAELPEPLKRARLQAIDRRKRASMLHAQLAAGEVPEGQSQQVCGEITRLMNAYTAAYDTERRWKDTGALPALHEDLEARLRKLSPIDLVMRLKNVVAPRVSQLRKLLKDGGLTPELEKKYVMDLGNFEEEKAMIELLQDELNKAASAGGHGQATE